MVSTLAGTAGNYGTNDGVGAAAQFGGPSGLALDGQGNLYVADTGNYTIREIDLATANVATVAGTPSVFGGTSDGIGPAAQFYYPQGLAYAAGVLYITDTGNHTLRQMTTSNDDVSTIAGMAGSSVLGSATVFSQPIAVAVDGAGHVFVADDGDSTVRQVDVATGFMTNVWGVSGKAKIVPGPLPAQLNRPVGLAYDSGKMFLVDFAENVVLSAALP
jgi:DNA-binding beta-propeller fold protein YncE